MSVSRLAVKRLTASDLTFFAVQYHQEGQRSKQKGINLNSDIFVDEFFPGLRGRSAEIHFPLVVAGPAGAGAQRLSRKAVRTGGAKNWRLNGEIIHDPPEEPGRYLPLQEGDLAVLGFDGDLEPSEVTMVLVSQTLDPVLHPAISRLVDTSWRQTFQVLSDGSLESMLSSTAAAYPDGHPLSILLAADSVLNALQGSVTEQERIASTDGVGHPVTRESVIRQSTAAAASGFAGEDAFETWLRQTGHEEDDYRWVSLTHAHAAYDFLVSRPLWNGGGRFVDVKATGGRHESSFYMSLAEVRWAAQHDEYRIARISELTDESARLVILDGVQDLCQRLLQSLRLPERITAVTFALDPSALRQVHSDTVELSTEE